MSKRSSSAIAHSSLFGPHAHALSFSGRLREITAIWPRRSSLTSGVDMRIILSRRAAHADPGRGAPGDLRRPGRRSSTASSARRRRWRARSWVRTRRADGCFRRGSEELHRLRDGCGVEPLRLTGEASRGPRCAPGCPHKRAPAHGLSASNGCSPKAPLTDFDARASSVRAAKRASVADDHRAGRSSSRATTAGSDPSSADSTRPWVLMTCTTTSRATHSVHGDGLNQKSGRTFSRRSVKPPAMVAYRSDTSDMARSLPTASCPSMSGDRCRGCRHRWETFGGGLDVEWRRISAITSASLISSSLLAVSRVTVPSFASSREALKRAGIGRGARVPGGSGG